MNVYLALGSNLQDPILQIKSALYALQIHPKFKLIKTSSLYQSKALTLDAHLGANKVEPDSIADYINAVVQIQTDLCEYDLLKEIQNIENIQGRVRGEKWASRTLDLDILLYGDKIINSKNLIVPHISMCERAFVMFPLAEIAPNIVIPNKGNIKKIIASLNESDLVKLQG